MTDSQRASGGGIGKKLRAQFLAGVLVVVPIGASILILVWLFSTVDNFLQPVARALWGHTVPGVGFGATLVLIYLAGVIASNVVGRKLLRYGDSLLARVPVFRQLYTGIRQILEGFSTPDKGGYMQVVLVEFPRKGMKAIGFVTNELTETSGEKLLSVFIPTAPNPTSGFLQIMKEEEVFRTEISLDDALKMIVSAGRMMSEKAKGRFPATT